MSKKISKILIITGVGTMAILVAGLAGYTLSGLIKDSNPPVVETNLGSGDSQVTELSAESLARIKVAADVSVISTLSLNDQLLYLIEEEKLAHDVYTVMYEKYGAQTFQNISRSEEQHQDRVAGLLDDFDIEDPRSDEVGVFSNTNLQELYTKLVEQGNQSLTEAYKVGVAIEELDISDITAQLDAIDPSESDVISVLEALKRGSENHLRAFSRKV